MSHPLHHLHKRKRIYQQNEPYPHPNSFKRFVDHLVYVMGIIGPLMGSLQAYKIWSEKNADGISIQFFSFLIVNDIVWYMYGYIHKEKPIMIMYILWGIVNIFIVAGSLLYG